jgi:hypothetical protein
MADERIIRKEKNKPTIIFSSLEILLLIILSWESEIAESSFLILENKYTEVFGSIQTDSCLFITVDCWYLMSVIWKD